MIEPLHPVELAKFDGFQVTPETVLFYHFGIDQADHGFGQRVIARTTESAGGRQTVLYRYPTSVCYRETTDIDRIQRVVATSHQKERVVRIRRLPITPPPDGASDQTSID